MLQALSLYLRILQLNRKNTKQSPVMGGTNSSDLVEEVTSQVLSLNTETFAIFTDTFFQVDVKNKLKLNINLV